MGKKITIDYVKNVFVGRKCVLKSTEYINAHTKLDYVCPNGHEHSITWANFNQGYGCPVCAGVTKPKIEDIRKEFELRGCILKSTEYKNKDTKLNYICPNGHEHSIVWYSFKRGAGCPYCAGIVKPDIKDIAKEFEDKGCVLKSTKYVNNKTKLDYICPNGHEHSVALSDFRRGNGCPYCPRKNKLKIEYIKNEFESKGCILKSTEYVNCQTKLDYICKNGHEHSIRWNDFKSGYGCPTCYALSISGPGSCLWKGGVTKLDIALYDTYGSQLAQFDFEEVRVYMWMLNAVVYKTLQVRCHNSGCRKWFMPTVYEVKNRLSVFNGFSGGANDFYCDEGCKQTCSTYKKIQWVEGENPKEKPYTKEEYDLYRQTVLERENYICEYCGAPATEVHHEQTQKEQPMLALDPDYGHATCKPCHYEYGHKTGTECSTGNLAKKIC